MVPMVMPAMVEGCIVGVLGFGVGVWGGKSGRVERVERVEMGAER